MYLKEKHIKMKPAKITFLSVLALSIAIPSFAATAKPGKTVMATVNGKNITANDVTIRLWGESGLKAINELIAEKVLLDEASKLKIIVPEESIDAFYKNYLGGRSAEDANKELSKVGWSDKDIKQQIKNQILINETIIKLGNINITDADVKNAYEASKDRLMTNETYDISQIAVATKAEAETILDALLKDRNSDFAAVAAEKSINAELRERAGKIGNVSKGQLPKDIEEEIFALRPGQISKIMQTGNIYSIFKINSIMPSRQLTLEETKGNIRNAIISQRLNEKKNEIMQDLIKKAEIKIK